MKKLILMLLATILLTSCTPYVYYTDSYPMPVPTQHYSCVVYYPSGISNCNIYGSWRMSTIYSFNLWSGYYGRYSYYTPVIVRPPTGAQNGRVINGKGYTSGTQYKESASRLQTPRTAVPRTQPRIRSAPPPAPARIIKPTPPVRRRGGG